MNGKQLACVVLLMIIGTITYAAQIVHKNTTVALEAAEAAQLDAQTAGEAKDIAKKMLDDAKQEARDLQRFLVAWTPQVQRMSTRQEVEEAILATTRNRGIFVVSQSFEDKTSGGPRIVPRSTMASIVVEDEYSKVLNWLGDLEKNVPLMRISSCRLSAAGTGRQLHLEVAMEMPLIDLTIDPTVLSKKK